MHRSARPAVARWKRQRRLTRKLFETRSLPAVAKPRQHRQRRPPPLGRGWGAAVMSAVLVLTAVAGAFGWRTFQGQDQVAAAVNVADQPFQLRSTDSAAIQTWCEREAERPVPVISSSSMAPIGARMDHSGGSEIITVTYVTAQDRMIRVSWLDAQLISPSARSVETRSVSGRVVLLVRSGAGTVIVSGDAPNDSLWDTAAGIQTVTGRNSEAEPTLAASLS
jgi:hypothetical protein